MTDELFRAIVAEPKVRVELARTASSIASAARTIAGQEGADTDITVEHGTRPRGRTYSRVVSRDFSDSEWGTAKRKRVRAIGRAAGLRP
ncbi:hypothetical protein [Lentzea kentuckyensis]|uniref:hypothetical protein n=1 Tax=Lentzea kentuckyensis TaxID=360086 RepID=UPI00117AD875|nr:hypothetical protein [Lentzea kentuckyensis]